MPFFRCYEEVRYEELLTTSVRKLMNTKGEKVLDMAGVSEVSLSKFVLEEPYDRKWFCRNHTYWAKDQDFEIRMRSRVWRSSAVCGMAQR